MEIIKTIQQIKDELNGPNTFPDHWEDWARSMEDRLNDILGVLAYQEKVIAGIQNVERAKWEAGIDAIKSRRPSDWAH